MKCLNVIINYLIVILERTDYRSCCLTRERLSNGVIRRQIERFLHMNDDKLRFKRKFVVHRSLHVVCVNRFSFFHPNLLS